jgi:hypothetical protein
MMKKYKEHVVIDKLGPGSYIVEGKVGNKNTIKKSFGYKMI